MSSNIGVVFAPTIMYSKAPMLDPKTNKVQFKTKITKTNKEIGKIGWYNQDVQGLTKEKNAKKELFDQEMAHIKQYNDYYAKRQEEVDIKEFIKQQEKKLGLDNLKNKLSQLQKEVEKAAEQYVADQAVIDNALAELQQTYNQELANYDAMIAALSKTQTEVVTIAVAPKAPTVNFSATAQQLNQTVGSAAAKTESNDLKATANDRKETSKLFTSS